MAAGVDPKLILSMFETLDADNSGSISAKEIRTFLKEELGLDKRAAIEFVSTIDQDGDGEVSMEELKAAIAVRSSFSHRALKAVGKKLPIDSLIGSMQAPDGEAFLDLRSETLVNWDFSPGGLGRTRNERRMPPSVGAPIALAEHRAMSLSQLRSLDRHIRRRCPSEAWMNECSQLLSAEAVSMYDTMAYVIKPATSSRQCTLCELVNSTACTPKWFVSHAWADSLLSLFTCMEQHGRDRGFDANGGAYWLAACGLNQWAPAESWLLREESTLVGEASFARAMGLCDGTMVVVDTNGHALGRGWVNMEVHLALSGVMGGSHLLDVYTPASATFETTRGHVMACNAVGLLHGPGTVRGLQTAPPTSREGRAMVWEPTTGGGTEAPAPAPADAPAPAPAAGGAGATQPRARDRRSRATRESVEGAPAAVGVAGAPASASRRTSTDDVPVFAEDVFERTRREGAFPMGLIERCLTVCIEHSETYLDSDHARILHAVANKEGVTGLAPPRVVDDHPAYAEADCRFAGFVAAAVVRRAFAQKPLFPSNDHHRAQREDQMSNMRRLHRVLEAVAASGLSSLSIDLRGSGDFTLSWSMINLLLPQLPPSLTSLAIAFDLDKCPKELFRQRASLTTLDLTGCGGLQEGVFGSAFRDADHHMASMNSLTTLLITHCADLDALPTRLADLPQLTTLNVSHCPRLTRLPDSLPPTLAHLILTKSPIASLGAGLSGLRHLQTVRSHSLDLGSHSLDLGRPLSGAIQLDA